MYALARRARTVACYVCARTVATGKKDTPWEGGLYKCVMTFAVGIRVSRRCVFVVALTSRCDHFIAGSSPNTLLTLVIGIVSGHTAWSTVQAGHLPPERLSIG